jgi:2-methylcitrate dehydratase PrpD
VEGEISEREIEVTAVTHALSRYLAGALDRELPPEVAEKGKHHLLDTLAAMISGTRLHPGEMTVKYIRTLGGAAESVVAGTGIVTSAVNAAMANAMLSHADETDDSHKASRSHLGCGVVPAALAMAEREGASGTALLRAVVLGYDIGARISFALDTDNFYNAGHSTHTFAPLFGAAAAAGALARLGPDQMRWMLSYAAQQASGVNCWQRDLDHIEKAFDFGGMAGRNGVTAATMVQAGFTGVDDVFTGPRNFFFAYTQNPRPEKLIDGLGARYEIMLTNIKKWSVGSPIQAPLDCIETLLADDAIAVGEIDQVTLRLSDREHSVVDDRHMPDICIQHMVAIMLLDGTVTFASAHDDRRMAERPVIDLRKRIALIGEPTRERRTAEVAIRMKDGRTFTATQDAVRGTPDNPMTRAEVEAKAYDLVAPILGKERGRGLIERIWAIETVSNARDLRPLLTA